MILNRPAATLPLARVTLARSLSPVIKACGRLAELEGRLPVAHDPTVLGRPVAVGKRRRGDEEEGKDEGRRDAFATTRA